MRRKDSAMDTNDLLPGRHDQKEATTQNSLDVNVLGVRCSSGLSTLDFALVRYRQRSSESPLCVEVLESARIDIPHASRISALGLLREPQCRPALSAHLSIQIGQIFSTGIMVFCQSHHVKISDIDFVGTHFPNLTWSTLARRAVADASTWNAVVQAETGLTTASDFCITEHAAVKPRISPVAFVNSLLLRSPYKFRACLDIDELVTISFLPAVAGDGTRSIKSFECGPGSLFIDYAMRYCTSNDKEEDHEGEYAANGVVSQEIVDRFLRSCEYLNAPPSLTMAREMFGDHDAQRIVDECLYASVSKADTVATITRITSANILKHYHKLLDLFFPNDQVDELFICGPSARNAHIVDFLETELPDTVITKPMDDIGIPGDANDTFCYAHLALETVLGQLSYTGLAGASLVEAVGGLIVPGRNWEQLSDQVRLFSKGNPLQVNRDIRVAGSLEASVRELDLR